jgi:hypothetical protein
VHNWSQLALLLFGGTTEKQASPPLRGASILPGELSAAHSVVEPIAAARTAMIK